MYSDKMNAVTGTSREKNLFLAMLLTHILLLEWSFLLYTKEKCSASKNLASTNWYGQNGLQIIYNK